MHERLEKSIARSVPSIVHSTPRSHISARDISEFFALRKTVILIPIVVCLVASYLYVLTTTPLYTAHAQIIIDPRLPQFIPGRVVDSVLAWDSAQVESEIAVLQSERIGALVVNKLDLDKDPAFQQPPGVISRIAGLVPFPAQDSGPPVDPVRRALGAISDGLSVRRSGLSYAIDISFTFSDPLRAEQVANATAEAYIADQLENRAEAARVGGEWLQRRMTLLRSQVNAASRAVQAFRASHNYNVAAPPAPVTTTAGNDTSPGPGLAQNGETLEELDSDAVTYRRIYESFLQSYTESVQRQSFPVSDAHILTTADLPLIKSAPRAPLIYSLAALIGCLFGLGSAVLVQQLDRRVRSASKIVDETGIDHLGTFKMPKIRSLFGSRQKIKRATGTGLVPAPARDPAKLVEGEELLKADTTPYLTAVLDRRNAAFAHSMLTFKVMLDLARTGHRLGCIGITAGQHGVGTSVISGNLAALYADEGHRTLLIDADLRQRSLSKAVRTEGRPGLLQVLAGDSTLETAVVGFGDLSLDFLPAASESASAISHDYALMSSAMAQLLRHAAEAYDVVIIDLPPALPVGGVLAVSSHLDGIVVTCKAGATTTDEVVAMVREFARAQASVLGFVLTQPIA